MDLTVVTAVRDDPLLPQAIASVPIDIEHVVALTRPSSTTIRLAQQLGGQRPLLQIVETAKVGMAAGVNLGVRAARHEKIVMLDSDCTLSRDTLEAYCRALDRAAFVRGRTVVRQGPGWARFSGLGQQALNKAFQKAPRLIGPSIAFRKTPFLALGGYDEQSGSSCDHEFVLRMEDCGIETLYADDAVVWHRELTFQIDCRSHVGYGRSMHYIDVKRASSYGLGVCLQRFYPSTLYRKLVQRGPASVLRSLLLGSLMLYGYLGPVMNRMIGER
jgi:GT2 family glycosyltransferase